MEAKEIIRLIEQTNDDVEDVMENGNRLHHLIIYNEPYLDFVNSVMDILEKSIPKIPVDFIYCPSCGQRVIYGRSCSNNDCRQAIDWSDD